MKKHRILIAEDEVNISDFVSRGLQDFGYETAVCNNGQTAWERLENGEAFDLLLLDIRMPDISGLEICQRFRDRFGYQTPVVMLTALGTTEDVVMGLHAGADDYLPKPFKFMELKARIEAHLRRAECMRQSQQLTCGDLSIDPASHQACRKGMVADLSIKEYRLLEYFIRHEGEVLSRRQLLKDVWDKDFDTNTNIVDVYIRYLRNKIDDPFDKKIIRTVVGKGYMLKVKE